MEIGKLFRVLVVGGASVAAFSCVTSDETDPDETQDAAVADVSLPDATTSDAGEVEAALCFCNSTPECCDGTDVAEGFECCWGTSC